MSTPQGMLKGQSIIRPPYFNGQHYGWWKNRMEKYIQADKEERVMFTRKFKKAKDKCKEKNAGKPRNSDREHLTGCFKCEQKQNQSRNSNKK